MYATVDKTNMISSTATISSGNKPVISDKAFNATAIEAAQKITDNIKQLLEKKLPTTVNSQMFIKGMEAGTHAGGMVTDIVLSYKEEGAVQATITAGLTTALTAGLTLYVAGTLGTGLVTTALIGYLGYQFGKFLDDRYDEGEEAFGIWWDNKFGKCVMDTSMTNTKDISNLAGSIMGSQKYTNEDLGFDKGMTVYQKDEDGNTTTYEIKKGDTVWDLCQKYGLTYEELIELNPWLADRFSDDMEFALIRPGEVLNIPIKNPAGNCNGLTVTKIPFDQANGAGTPGADPILVDLNGDGVIGTVGVENGKYFDHQVDGFAENSAWVDKNDGILVIDKNGNGVIDNGSEVFGDNYVKSDNSKATSGFDALRDLDSNNDGIINSEDKSFSQIKILKGDGTLLTLEEAGITSINLDSTSSNTTDENGNTLVSSSTFTKSDGTTGSLGDFNLIVNKMDSFAVNWVNESEEVSKLPDILGCGTLYSLHQAMMRDGSSVGLKKLVNDFVNAESDSVKRELVEKIIYRWCNCDSVSDGSRGTHYDAKKLNIIERFMGERFRGVNNNGIPNIWAAPFLDNVYNMITNYVYCKLEVQINDSFVKNIYDMFELEYSFDNEVVRYNFDKVIGYIDSVLSEDEGLGKTKLLEVNEIIQAFGLNNDLDNVCDFGYCYYLNRNKKWDLKVA